MERKPERLDNVLSDLWRLKRFHRKVQHRDYSKRINRRYKKPKALPVRLISHRCEWFRQIGVDFSHGQYPRIPVFFYGMPIRDGVSHEKMMILSRVDERPK